MEGSAVTMTNCLVERNSLPGSSSWVIGPWDGSSVRGPGLSGNPSLTTTAALPMSEAVGPDSGAGTLLMRNCLVYTNMMSGGGFYWGSWALVSRVDRRSWSIARWRIIQVKASITTVGPFRSPTPSSSWAMPTTLRDRCSLAYTDLRDGGYQRGEWLLLSAGFRSSVNLVGQ